MDHIVKKLSEIEHAAEAVVEHAELEKSELEERIQNERSFATAYPEASFKVINKENYQEFVL